MGLLPKAFIRQTADERRAAMHRSLLRHLAKLGGKVFGPVSAGGRREFFCLDSHTWVWHEEWTDSRGQHHALTTRYDVRPNGILKSQGPNSYQRLSVEEERNFRSAVRIYCANTRLELQRLTEMA